MSRRINENLFLTSARFLKQKDFWLNRLTPDIGETNLLLFAEMNRRAGADRQEIEISFPLPLSGRLLKLGRQSDISIYIILLAGLKSLIYRYTGEEDIIVMSPVLEAYVTEDTMNDYVFVRDSLSGDATFRELLIQVRQSVLDAYDHQDYPAHRLLEMVFSERQESGEDGLGRITNVMCTLKNLHISGGSEEEREKLLFSFSREEERIDGRILCDAGLYDSYDVKRFASHFVNFLENSLQDIDAKVSVIPFLPEEEKNRLIYDFNQTEVVYPADRTVHELLERQAEETPDTVALVHEEIESGLCWAVCFGELNRRANRLARLLRAKGVSSETIAAIMVELPDRMVTGMVAILKAGGAYLPLDPAYPAERRRILLRDSGVPLLVTQSSLLKNGEDECGLTGEDIVYVDEENIYSGEDGNLGRTSTPENMIYVMYTSGSSGIPKGVAAVHRNVVNVLTWFCRQFNLRQYTHVLQLTDYFFDPSVEDIFGALISGSTLYTGNGALVADREQFCRYVLRNRIHIVNYVPRILKELLCHDTSLESLRAVISGGEPLEDSVKDQILARGYNLYNNYGPTEITVDALSVKCDEGRVRLGKPIANTKCYILNKQNQLTAVAGVGELCIVGAGVTRGYLNNPELTARQFIDNPHVPGEKIYRTGDQAAWTVDGNVEFFGRIDFQVKIRGHRIELGEIENQLLQHEGIGDAVVTAVEMGAEKFLCAHYVKKSTRQPELEPESGELREYLSSRLPGYMIPSYFLQMDKLPRTPGGKLDRKSLPEFDGFRPDLEATYVAPQNNLEIIIAGIWREVLKLDQVGVHDNFFGLGGNSLRLITVHTKLKKVFEKEVSVVDMLRYPTISSLSEHLGRDGVDVSFFDSNRSDIVKRGKKGKKQRLQKRKELRNGL